MQILVGVISHAAAWVIPRGLVDQIRREFPQHTIVEAWDHDTIRRRIPEVEVAFVPWVDRAMLTSAPRLRWIQTPAVGVEAMLYPEMVESPVVITTARGIRSRAIAEHVMGVSIALARRFHVAIRRQAAHQWAQDELEGETTAITTLCGRRMGLVGLGSIGSEIARLAGAFGLRVTAIRRRAIEERSPTRSVTIDECLPADRLDGLLARSDIVVLAAPWTPATDRLIGVHELSVIKPGALLVNVARGTLVDDDAVVAALRAGRLGGAALDVFTSEPLPSSSPYWDLPNVIITPHTSGAMAEYWTALVALFSENLRRLEAGHPLVNQIDKRSGY